MECGINSILLGGDRGGRWVAYYGGLEHDFNTSYSLDLSSGSSSSVAARRRGRDQSLRPLAVTAASSSPTKIPPKMITTVDRQQQEQQQQQQQQPPRARSYPPYNLPAIRGLPGMAGGAAGYRVGLPWPSSFSSSPLPQ